MEPLRDDKGRLLPGNTANPKGRPKRKSFREFFTEEEEEALINKLKTSDKPEIWIKIAEQLFGKPRQNIGLDGGEDGKPINVMSYEQARAIIGGKGSNKGDSQE